MGGGNVCRPLDFILTIMYLPVKKLQALSNRGKQPGNACYSNIIPQLLQVGGDGLVELRGFGLLGALGRGEPLHLLFERLAVVCLRFGADVAAGGKHVAVLAHLFQRRALAEAGHVAVNGDALVLGSLTPGPSPRGRGEVKEMLLTMSMSWPRRCLSSAGRA